VVCEAVVTYLFLLAKPIIIVSPLLRLIERMANEIKCLVQKALRVTHNSSSQKQHSVILSFLATVENATPLEPRQRLQGNNFTGLDADICRLCQSHVMSKPGQGCYWTHAQMYHIDCITCPSCNSLPKLIYPASVNPYAQYPASVNPYPQCSRCARGDMMDIVSQKIGDDFIIIHCESLLYIYTVWIAWTRVAKILMPNSDPGKQLHVQKK
jgi:hypothetical protein